jgi:hypothetical protein
MNILRKMDSSSKWVILTGLVGILFALFSLYKLNNDGNSDLSNAKKVGKVASYLKDSRLKRLEKISWHSITQSTDAYEGDLFFTGDDSFITIELDSGDKITLLPNSLVSLSKNFISLQSGGIEVDIGSETPLELESFGERISLDEKSNMRIVQDVNSTKIIPLNDLSKDANKPKSFSNFKNSNEIALVLPKAGSILPAMSGYVVTYQWVNAGNASGLFVEFYRPGINDPFLKVPGNNGSLSLPLRDFPDGIINWKVVSSSGLNSKRSTFYLTKDHKPKLVSPKNRESFPFEYDSTLDLEFEWISSFNEEFKFQVSSDVNFEKIFKEESLMGKNVKVNFPKDGQYFWRVGSKFQEGLVSWSDPNEFNLKSNLLISPIEVILPSPVFDFAFNSSYLARIKDNNNCNRYKMILRKDNRIVSEFMITQKQHSFTKIKDGSYELEVIGYIKDKPLVKTATSFQVRTSPPLKAPRIKKDKHKVFVFLEVLYDFILPSAQAAEKVITLSWEKKSEAAVYEFEMYKKSDQRLVQKKLLSRPQVNINLSRPGEYIWRVRFKSNNRWSPFSEYATIEVDDKINLIKRSLMIFPVNGQTIKSKGKTAKVKFKWAEPFPDHKYFLELFKGPDSKPIKKISVKGSAHTLKFKNKKSAYWWRIISQSTFGNLSPKTERFYFTLQPERIEKPPPVKKKLPHKFMARFEVGQTTSSFSQNAVSESVSELNTNLSFSGYAAFAQGEFWPGWYANKHGASISYKFNSLISGVNTLENQELAAEYGYKLLKQNKSPHTFYVGILRNTVSMSFGTLYGAQYEVNFLTTRYNYIYNFSKKWGVELDAKLLFRIESELKIPSFRLKSILLYGLTDKWFVTTSAEYERNTMELEFDSNNTTGIINLTFTNLSYSLGVKYLF